MFGLVREVSKLEHKRKKANERVSLGDHRESLQWTATIITGDPEVAEQVLIDATGLSKAGEASFRDWLVEWAHLATARAAVNTVRTSIREAAERYAKPICSHRKHEFLPAFHVQLLHEASVQAIAEQLDVVARTVLVLHGCQRLSFSDCTLLMNLPLQTVVGAYCRATAWFNDCFLQSERIRNSESECLHEVRHDPDGVPVWG